MPRTFLVKKFKKQDASSPLRINKPVKEKEEKIKTDNDEPSLLQNHQVTCVYKGDGEVKTSLECKENTEGNCISNAKNRTAIFMPVINTGEYKEQSGLQKVKQGTLESSFKDVEMGNEHGTSYLIKQRTEGTSDYSRKLIHNEHCSIMNTKTEKNDNTRRLANVKFNNSKQHCEYNKNNNEGQSIKRPVALLPERCKCKECQTRNSFYFRKYKVPSLSFDMKKKSVLDDTHRQDVKTSLNFTQEEEAAYLGNELITDRSLSAAQEETINESCYHKRFLCLEANKCPREFSVCKMNRSSSWPYKKSEFEKKKERDILPIYFNREKHVNRPFLILKGEEKDERTLVPNAVHPMVRPHTMFHFHQMVNHIRLRRNDSNAENSAGTYKGEHGISEKCGCGECLKATGIISVAGQYGMGQCLAKSQGHYEKSKQKIWKTEIKGEEELETCSSSWMTTADSEIENINCEKVFESDIEEYEGNKTYAKFALTNDNHRFLVTKRSLVKSNMKRETEINANDHHKNSKANGEPISKNDMTEENFKHMMEVELECQMKSPKKSSVEEIECSRKGDMNIQDKDRKITIKQQKEKDSGKKSRALANWLERKRVAELNDAFERLRRMVPTYGNEDRSLSKIKTLRYATTYIRHLALIHEKQCRYEIEDLKKGLKKVLEMDPMLKRCQEHLESNCII